MTLVSSVSMALLIGQTLGVAPGADETPARPVGVCFVARKTPPEAPAARQARLAEAQRKADELEKALKAQYGSDPRKWSPARRLDLLKARNAAQDDGQEVAQNYEQATREELTAAARDLTKAAAGKHGGGVLRASACPQAQLEVEVLGRHSEPGDATTEMPSTSGLLLRISPGGRLDRHRVEDAMVFWVTTEWEGGTVNELHSPSAEEPFWTLEVVAPGTWADAADYTAALLADFVKGSEEMFAPPTPE